MITINGTKNPTRNIAIVYFIKAVRFFGRTYIAVENIIPINHVVTITERTGLFVRLKCAVVNLTATILSRLMTAKQDIDVTPERTSMGKIAL